MRLNRARAELPVAAAGPTPRVIAEGVRFLASRARLIAEPAGAAATGALLAGAVRVRPGERVVSIVSGGNADLGRLAQIFGP